MEELLFCRSGGCTAKLGAGALQRILSKLEKREDKNLLVGFDSSDDAAIYQLTKDIAIVQTLDFFPPMVKDPYLFGQIAATNALSDIYAMGGEVKTALNIVCFPETMDLNVLGKILQGGNDKVLEAGGNLVGGHSIHDNDVKYGLSVTGVVHPDKILKNIGCQEGDVLFLTKPLGVGIVCTALKMGQAVKRSEEEAMKSMTTLNKYAAELFREFEVHACTDITGFGFLVHLLEMLNQEVSAVIDSSQIPYIYNCRKYVDEFFITGAAQKNRNFAQQQVEFMRNDFFMEELLYDAQTSGGLLVSVKADQAREVMHRFSEMNIPCALVGHITKKKEKQVYIN